MVAPEKPKGGPSYDGGRRRTYRVNQSLELYSLTPGQLKALRGIDNSYSCAAAAQKTNPKKINSGCCSQGLI
ncbi:hypothetical protein NQZ68_001628 [Dissostichus eleginoides]|nr:hypothetical protein NQZ68_001628 [Dissostichus eleginoides]